MTGRRGAGRAARLAARLAAVAALAVLGAAVAAAAAGAARAPFTISVGDTVTVTGTPIACAATGSATTPGLLCSLSGAGGGAAGGAGGKEPEGSYGVALSARGEALVAQFARGGATVAPRKLWRVPARRRAAAGAGAAGSEAARVHSAGIGDAWLLKATDLRCDVKRAGLVLGVVCARFAGGQPRPDTNSIAITAEAAGVWRFDGKRRAVRKIEKEQPSSS